MSNTKAEKAQAAADAKEEKAEKAIEVEPFNYINKKFKGMPLVEKSAPIKPEK